MFKVLNSLASSYKAGIVIIIFNSSCSSFFTLMHKADIISVEPGSEMLIYVENI